MKVSLILMLGCALGYQNFIVMSQWYLYILLSTNVFLCCGTLSLSQIHGHMDDNDY